MELDELYAFVEITVHQTDEVWGEGLCKSGIYKGKEKSNCLFINKDGELFKVNESNISSVKHINKNLKWN